ncbi:hypothetical protein BT96DRAFT_928645 [Gymnopus androsaceus JB14]|uniref:Hydrophobin n=1 Tax=Gymnopus androsaceus JB14 TaxID=1447944 RepID=A0A6A4GK45_9AGAR|nr:hypothetical protein BT96DRAFT_928645 [Gymnopus androsaceus JB14]
MFRLISNFGAAFSLSVFLLMLVQVMNVNGLPGLEARQDVVYHCGGTDTKTSCPPGYTCCGPIVSGIGGTCVLLGESEVCAL